MSLKKGLMMISGLILIMIMSVMIYREAFAYYACCDLFAYKLVWYDAKEGVQCSETLVERENGSFEKGYIMPGERLMIYDPDADSTYGFTEDITLDGTLVNVQAMCNLEEIDKFATLTHTHLPVYGKGRVSEITDAFDYNENGTEAGTLSNFGDYQFNVYTFYKRAYFTTTGIKSPAGDEHIDFVDAYEAVLSDNGGGMAVADEKYGIEGSRVTIKAEAYRGYNFREWQLLSGNTVISDKYDPVTSFVFKNEDVKIRAIFDPVPYSVTILSDGNGSAYASPDSAVKGTPVSVNAIPYYGYRFKEWQVVSENVNIADDSFIMTDEDVILRAVFEKIPDHSGTKIFTITFDANEGSVFPTSDITDPDGTLFSLPVAVREKYVFRGWWTLPKNGERVSTDTVFDADSTVYAHWEKEPEPEIVKYKQLDLEGRKISGEVPSVRLYFPRHTVTFDGKEHVAAGTKSGSVLQEGVLADLDIASEGIPATVSSDYIYGKTKYAISYYALVFEPDTSCESYKAMGEKERKVLGKEIKRINRVLKKKKNRIYYAVKPLDLGEFVYTASDSKSDKKVFVRSDGSGDKLVYKKRTRKYTDNETMETKRITRTELEATLSGYKFTIPSREYKIKISEKNSRLTGRNINLTGETVLE